MNQSIAVPNLTSGSTFYYVAVARDSNGNTSTSSQQSFTTVTSPPPPPPSPPPPPTISILESNCSLYFVKDGSQTLITTDDYGSCPGQTDIVQSANGYGVVWRENRSGTETTQIYFKKIDENGQALTSDVKLTQAISARGLPSIAWTGSEFGVAWQDGRDAVIVNGSNITYGNQYEIYFVSVSASGVKNNSEVRVTNCVEHCGGAQLSWNSAGYYDLTWSESGKGTFSARLNTSGGVI